MRLTANQWSIPFGVVIGAVGFVTSASEAALNITGIALTRLKQLFVRTPSTEFQEFKKLHDKWGEIHEHLQTWEGRGVYYRDDDKVLSFKRDFMMRSADGTEKKMTAAELKEWRENMDQRPVGATIFQSKEEGTLEVKDESSGEITEYDPEENEEYKKFRKDVEKYKNDPSVWKDISKINQTKKDLESYEHGLARDVHQLGINFIRVIPLVGGVGLSLYDHLHKGGRGSGSGGGIRLTENQWSIPFGVGIGAVGLLTSASEALLNITGIALTSIKQLFIRPSKEGLEFKQLHAKWGEIHDKLERGHYVVDDYYDLIWTNDLIVRSKDGTERKMTGEEILEIDWDAVRDGTYTREDGSTLFETEHELRLRNARSREEAKYVDRENTEYKKYRKLREDDNIFKNYQRINRTERDLASYERDLVQDVHQLGINFIRVIPLVGGIGLSIRDYMNKKE